MAKRNWNVIFQWHLDGRRLPVTARRCPSASTAERWQMTASGLCVTVVNPAILSVRKKTSIVIRSTRSIADPLADLNPWRNSCVITADSEFCRFCRKHCTTFTHFCQFNEHKHEIPPLEVLEWRHKILHCGSVNRTAAARQWTDIFEIHTAVIATAESLP